MAFIQRWDKRNVTYSSLSSTRLCHSPLFEWSWMNRWRAMFRLSHLRSLVSCSSLSSTHLHRSLIFEQSWMIRWRVTFCLSYLSSSMFSIFGFSSSLDIFCLSLFIFKCCRFISEVQYEERREKNETLEKKVSF